MKRLLRFLTMFCVVAVLSMMSQSMKASAHTLLTYPENSYTGYAGQYTIWMQMDRSWTASTSDSYIHIDNTSGGSGRQVLGFKLDKNTSGSNRMGFINIYDGNPWPCMTLEINQDAYKLDGYFKIVKTPFSNGKVTIGPAATELKFTIESNKKVSVLLDGKNVRLISQKSDGNGGTRYEYGLPVSANITSKNITHNLNIAVDAANVEGGKYHYFYINQLAFPTTGSFGVKVDVYNLSRITPGFNNIPAVENNIFVVASDSKYVCGLPFVSVGGNGKKHKTSADIAYVPNGNRVGLGITYQSVKLDWVLLNVANQSSTPQPVASGCAGVVSTSVPITNPHNQFFLMPQTVYDFYNKKFVYTNGSLKPASNPNNAPVPYVKLCTVREVNSRPTTPSDRVLQYP